MCIILSTWGLMCSTYILQDIPLLSLFVDIQPDQLHPQHHIHDCNFL